MSRIGNNPVQIPSGVTVSLEDHKVLVNGPKGNLETEIRPEIKVEVEEGRVLVKRKRQDRLSRALHGLTRSLVNNMVFGSE